MPKVDLNADGELSRDVIQLPDRLDYADEKNKREHPIQRLQPVFYVFLGLLSLGVFYWMFVELVNNNVIPVP